MTSTLTLIGLINAAAASAKSLAERFRAECLWELAADADRLATDLQKNAVEAQAIARRAQSQDEQRQIEDLSYRAPEMLPRG